MLPTGRDLRFALLRAFSATAPALAARSNVFTAEADWSTVASEIIEPEPRRSERMLSEADQRRLSRSLTRELQQCGEIHRDSVWRYEVGVFDDAMVLGHNGQAVETPTKTSITPVDRKMARAAVLSERRIEGIALNFVHRRDGLPNYFHLLTHRMVMQRDLIEICLERFDAPITVLVRKNGSSVESVFRREIERRFPRVRIDEVEPNERVVPDRTIQARVTKNCGFRDPYSAQSIDDLREMFFSAYGLTPTAHGERHLFVSRKDARIRNILNEDALYERLAPFGYERIRPGDLSHEEQVRTFSEAGSIIGPHGAGLSNLIFMPLNGRVLEIFGGDYVQGEYLWLSFLRGLDYDFVVINEDHAHQDFRMSDFELDAVVAKLMHPISA